MLSRFVGVSSGSASAAKRLAFGARAVAIVTVSLLAAWAWLRSDTQRDTFKPDLVMNMVLGEPLDPWISTASTGAIDTSDLEIARTSGAVLQLTNSAPNNATLNVRYNVLPTPGLINNLGCVLLISRFRDNGDNAQVIAKLKRYRLETGETQTLLTVNSNNFPDDGSFQLGNEFDCDLTFDFFQFAYFIDVELIKSGSTGKPALGALRLSTFPE
jgi:hypothetical protein